MSEGIPCLILDSGRAPIRAGHELDWPSLADYLREHHILSRLWKQYPRAPRSLLLCTDESVIGSDFVVHDLRVGEVIWQDLAESLASEPDAGRRIGFAVVDALADLHMVDPDSCGLGDVDTGEGFIDRQLDGWRHRWTEVADDDFDPLMDVGILLNQWPDSRDTAHDHAIVPAVQYSFGLPTRTEMVERYSARTGVDPERITWYRASAAWRTAISWQMDHHHHFGSRSQDPTSPQSVDVPIQIGRARRLLRELSG